MSPIPNPLGELLKNLATVLLFRPDGTQLPQAPTWGPTTPEEEAAADEWCHHWIETGDFCHPADPRVQYGLLARARYACIYSACTAPMLRFDPQDSKSMLRILLVESWKEVHRATWLKEKE